MIDATARLIHYAEHLAPTWLALPEALRGDFWVPWDIEHHVRALGVTPAVYRGENPPWRADRDPILVAAHQDVRRAAAAGRPVVYQGHGVGQSFWDPRDPGVRRRGYSGGAGFEHVQVFLAVNERHAALWREAYPAADTIVVGCPKLGGRTREVGPRGALVVASFHWRALIGIPEAGTAWDDYRVALPDLARRFDLALHAHPRIRKTVAREARRLGVPFIDSFDGVLDRAAVYVNDASSTLYEFAAYGGPVVVLNSPRFRRHVHHGLRFWDCADAGIQVERPEHLVNAVRVALTDPPQVRERRREVCDALYPAGDAAGRAAAAVASLVNREWEVAA